VELSSTSVGEIKPLPEVKLIPVPNPQVNIPTVVKQESPLATRGTKRSFMDIPKGTL